jgi:hypothetical protein
MRELKQHPFFQGIDWEHLREGPAPVFTPPQPPSGEDMSLDWELTSLFNSQPVRYEYLPSGTAV